MSEWRSPELSLRGWLPCMGSGGKPEASGDPRHGGGSSVAGAGTSMHRKCFFRAMAVLLLVFFHGAAAGSAQEREPEWMVSSDDWSSIAGNVMNHRALTEDPTELWALAGSLDRHDRQIPPEENIEHTREDIEQLREALSEWQSAGIALRATGGFAGAAVGAGIGGLLGAPVPLALAGAFAGQLITDRPLGVVRRSIERRIWQAQNDQAQNDQPVALQGQALMERAVRDESFGPVWREVFEPRTGFGLDDDPHTVMKSADSLTKFLGEKGMHDDIVAILEPEEERPVQPGAGDGAETDAQTVLKRLMGSIPPMLDQVREAQDAVVASNHVVSEATERWVIEERRLREERRRQEDMLRNRTNLANARSAIGLAATVIGFKDPDTGRKVGAVTDAVFQVHDAMRAFDLAARAGANAELAGAALTGNFLAIGLGVIGVFADDGPSPERIILEEVGKLQEQVRTGFMNVHEHLTQVREEMHDRFDGMDVRFDEVDVRFDEVIRQVDSVHAKLADGFAKVLEQGDKIGGDLAKTREELRAVRDQLNVIEDNQRVLYRRMIKDHEDLERLMVGLSLAECLVERFPGSMDEQLFDTCLGRFQFLTRWRADRRMSDLGEEMLLMPSSAFRESDEFRDWLDSTATLSFEKFRRLLVAVERKHSRPELPQGVVGPLEWFAIVDGYDYFLEMYPGHVEKRAGGNSRPISRTVNSMRERRNDLRLYLNAIRSELQMFQGSLPGHADGAAETVFSKLFEEIWNSHAELDTLIHSIQNDYYGNEEAVTVRVRSGDGNENIPEVAHDNRYSWAPMSEFYGREELPDWLTIHRYDGCGLSELERRAMRLEGSTRRRSAGLNASDGALEWSPASADWFRGSGILNYVHPDDLIPARFGMGKVEVCVTGARHPRTEQVQLAMQIWSSGRGSAAREACRSLLLDDVAQGPRTPGNEFDLSGLPLELAGRVRERRPVLIDASVTDGSMSACQNLYQAQFAAKQKELSGYLRERLSESDRFKEIARNLNIASAHLRTWIALALDNAMARSATVAMVASGGMFPDLEAMLDDPTRGPTWRLVDEAGDMLQSLEEVLRSEAMRDALTFGYGHRWLTGTGFAALGDLQ